MNLRLRSDTALLERRSTVSPAAADSASDIQSSVAPGARSGGFNGPWRGPAWPQLSARRWVLLACLATFGFHLMFLSRELTSDEGGFAMVARGWLATGPYLYGSQWVDRPPGLMVVFAAAHALGPFGVRLMAGVGATALVAAAAWAAGAVRGGQAATWSAWTAFALATSPFLGAYQLNGELIAAPLVMLACAATLHTVYRNPAPTRTLLLGMLSGAAAAGALLVKQNFGDGLVFVSVLLISSALLRRTPLRQVVLTTAGALVGAAAPVAAAAWWATTHAGIGALVYAMYGFRADAGDVIAMYSLAAPEARLETLVRLALFSGMVLLAIQLVTSQWRAFLTPSPVVWAVSGAAAVELVGVVLGASYWPHYLIALIPMLALVTGLAASSPLLVHPIATRARRGQVLTRLLALLAVLTTSVAAPAAAVAVHTYRSHSYLVGRWLASSAQRSDTVVVPFTHANVIEASGLSSPYPYSWSLPVRTLDPDLTLFSRTLTRRQGAPTWVVRWDAPHTWGLDPRDHVTHALETHYRQVAVVCGHPVWLHRGIQRPLPVVPEGCGPSYSVSSPAASS